MSIKAYKNYVVPCPCKREWTWMLNEQHIRCSEALNDNPDFEGCQAIACQDCIYSSNPQRAEYYKHCFLEARPKLTVEVFNRFDCPDWAKWAAVDSNGGAYWYASRPVPLSNDDIYSWSPKEGKYKSIKGEFDASDWEHSLIKRESKPQCSDCKKKEINTWKGLVIPVPPKKEWTWHHNKGCCVAGGKDKAGCAAGITFTCVNCIYSCFHIKQFNEFYKYKYGTSDSASCSTCKNYEPKESSDREMAPVYEFDWYTQWKYSPSEDTYYYLDDLNKNRARELRTGELVNEIPADVVVVRPKDPSPTTLIGMAVIHVQSGMYYTVQSISSSGSIVNLKDLSYSRAEFYKACTDIYGRPVCAFERVTR